ncbi:unnamed protein product [Colias eurytheme]|nr:unnamed protein product [Colias eurytheme]
MMNNCYIGLIRCLSTDRKLTNAGEFYDIYVKLLIGEVSSKLSVSPLFCWECNAVLQTIHKFREKVKQANICLNEGLKNFNTKICLSTLSTSNISDNIIYAIHSEENDINIKDEEEIAADDNFNKETISLENEILTAPIQLNAIKSDDSDLENDVSMGAESADEKEDTDNLEDDEDFVLENDKDKVHKSKGQKSSNNVRYTVKKRDKEEIRVLFNKCERVRMDDNEITLWRDKAKSMQNYRTMTYQCETCIIGFSTKHKYNAHARKYHPKKSSEHLCEICKQRVPQKQLEAHIEMHKTKYVCCVCREECYPENKMYKHLNKMHRNVLSCVKCRMQFGRRFEVRSHYKNMHLRFECDHCGQIRTSKKNLIDHLKKRHTKPKCEICGKLFKSRNSLMAHHIATHVKSSGDNYCVECNMHFNNEHLLKRHFYKSVKHNGKRFPCTECDSVFSNSTALSSHYDFRHLKKTKYYCEPCDRYFLNASNLKVHKASSFHDHVPNPKTKLCTICGRAFHTNRILQNHIRTHTGERPFKCDFCEAAFAQISALVSHMRAIHKFKKSFKQ